MKINFISNFSLNDSSGGWNGINYKMYNSLNNLQAIYYEGPINPPVSLSEKVHSKFFRLIGGFGKYFFFSESRLEKINKDLLSKTFQGDFNFFFGASPWVKYNPKVPYAVYLDICFPRYLDIFHKGQRFSKNDICRISNLEKEFLKNANHIFWGSNWALNEARVLYNEKLKNSTVISTGGHIPIPTIIKNTYQKKLLFISLNFEKKGGWLAFDVFKHLKNEFPDLLFSIIGEKPPLSVLNFEGVKYIGLLDKTKKEDVETFIHELETAFFLIHPTNMDTMGAVIAEAGYYGLPAIAPNNFGIPDLIIDKFTGLLVELPMNKLDFIMKLREYIKDNKKYSKMREEVFHFMSNKRSWPSISSKILNKIQN